MTSNIAIIKENEKLYVRLQLSIPETQGAFLGKVILDGFTNKIVFQCDIQVVENTFVDDSK